MLLSDVFSGVKVVKNAFAAGAPLRKMAGERGRVEMIEREKGREREKYGKGRRGGEGKATGLSP